MNRKAFTLIELLVVIAIIAILAVVVVLTLNPAELLRQSRDANRLSDMATLNSALNLYQTDQGSLPSAATTYLSISSPSSTCQTLGMPTSSYAYGCSSSSSYRTVNGAGWIPVNFGNISAGTPLGSLPVDPTNQTSTGLYYTYLSQGGFFETTAFMESAKYAKSMQNSGGPDPGLFEIGTGANSLPDTGRGLIGFWPLNEGTASTTYDWSGGNSTGTWQGLPVGTNGYYSAGKLSAWAGALDGTTTYISVPTTPSLVFSGPITMAAWVYPKVSNVYQGIILKGSSGDYGFYLDALGTGYIFLHMQDVNIGRVPVSPGWSVNAWNYVVVTANGTNIQVYINSALAYSTSSALEATYSSSTLYIGSDVNGASHWLNGYLSDVRIYDRALSAAEIQEIYNAEK